MSKVYILGGAQTDFERNWSKEGKNVVALLREALEDGLSSVGLTFGDVQKMNQSNKIACYIGNFIAENYINQGHLGALLTEVDPCFYGIPSARYEAACASGSVALDAAISKIKCGDYEVAVVIGWELMKTVDSRTGADFIGKASFYEKEAKNIEYPFPKLFGRLADELIDKYGLNEEQFLRDLARIANMNYANAKRNPLAQTRKWFMSECQANMRGSETNPFIGGKLAISDCSQVTDGAAIVVLISEKFKEDNYPDRKLPIVKGFGHRVAPMMLQHKMDESKNQSFILPWTRQAVVDAYGRAGLSVEDIDVFETHDCFTPSEYVSISAFGITEPGKEYEVIENGLIGFEGKKPINPSGGLIGCGHPVGASGTRMFLDLFKQVSGQAGTYQIPGAQNGLMLNIGGTATTNFVFIVGNED